MIVRYFFRKLSNLLHSVNKLKKDIIFLKDKVLHFNDNRLIVYIKHRNFAMLCLINSAVKIKAIFKEYVKIYI